VDLRNDGFVTNGELRECFKEFFRIPSGDFENLVRFVGPSVNKKTADFRNAISVTDRLANGDSYHSMMYLFKVPTQFD